MAFFPPIDYNRVFTRIPEIMGMELTFKNRWWEGQYYLDGGRHDYKKDKLKVKLQKGTIWIYEQGGESITLLAWLVQYGGCADYKAAFDVIRGGDRPVTDFKHFVHKKNPTLYVPRSEFDAIKEFPLDKCPLFRWMCGMFGEEKTREVWERYCVTTDSNGNAVYFYVDEQGRICHENRIPYMLNGHRNKKYNAFRKYTTDKGYTGRCLFGAHLIKDADVVNVVESEKSALLASCMWGDRKGLWVATGGLSNIGLISNISEKRIRLFPDIDGTERWSQYGEIVEWWHGRDFDDHDDVGDLVVRLVEEWRNNRYW